MSRLVLSAIGLALGLLLIWANPALADRRVALVIGNSAYQNAPALANPRRDAQAMAAMFEKAGFDVVSAESDVGIVQFKRAIAQFADEASRSDIAVVYYSGYGIDVGGINYLVPVDAKLASDRDAAVAAITLDGLAKSVDKAKRLRLVIVDASRGDPFVPATRQQAADPGLAEPEPTPGEVIAYAAIAGTEAEDGDGEHSTYTAALLHNLFTPGLDIRLAFGRILVDVLKKTSKRQNPLVYGSFGGGNIALVPAPRDRPSRDLEGEKIDYGVVQKIGLARAYEVFLVQHPTGLYSTVAREELRIAETQPAKSQATRPPVLGPIASLEGAPPVIAPPGSLPEVNSPGQISVAQQELTRVGCFSGAADGSLDAATKAAIRQYLNARGQNPSGDVEITDDFVAELKQQTAEVCALVCPAGKIAEGKKCVDIGKSPAVARRKNEDDQGRPAKRNVAKQEQKSAPPPRVTQQTSAPPPRVTQQTSGNSGHSSVTIGVGF
jgi:peptidoglycan hydrolase-like protein with peptidoglycan-binding domain